MMLRRTLQFLLLFFPLLLSAQDTSVVFRLYLAGDGGDGERPGPALLQLGKELEGRDSAAVIFLGDNSYPGLHPKYYSRHPFRDVHGCNKLFAQLAQLKRFEGSAYVIPGNHDWLQQRRNGAASLERQEREVKLFLADSCSFLLNPSAERFLPSAQTPGPVAVQPFPGFRLIALDTQYPLQNCIKSGPGQMNARKRKRVLKKMAHELDSLITEAKTKNEQIIIAGHHPMYTNGEHAGHLWILHGLVDYTPLKIFGWLGVDRPLSQDMVHPRYRRMRKYLLPVLEKHGDLLYVSGHDHNLQYLTDAKSNHYLVSGAVSKKDKLKKKQKFPSKFQEDKQTGFFCVEFLKNGQRRIIAITADGAQRVVDTF